MGETIRMTMSDGAEIDVYQAPAVGRRKGGLIVLHEIFGLNPHIRELSDDLAKHGYEVLSPALFDREWPGFVGSHDRLEEAAGLANGKHPFELSVADALTLIDALKDKGPVFITGFCYGGTIAFRAAQLRADLAACSSFYGHLDHIADEPVKVPTITHFGRNDPYVPMEGVEKIIAKRTEVEHFVYEAGHGFVSGKPDYNPEAKALSLSRTFELFDKYAAS